MSTGMYDEQWLSKDQILREFEMRRSMYRNLWFEYWMFRCQSFAILYLFKWIHWQSFGCLLWNSKTYVFSFLKFAFLRWKNPLNNYSFCSPHLVPEKPEVQLCHPSPCGPYSQCKEFNERAICSCIENYIGSPPACRPECSINSECLLDKACVNHKCVDPCASSVCGDQARCQAINHNPICSCPLGYVGDPFIRCTPAESKLFICTVTLLHLVWKCIGIQMHLLAESNTI